MSLTSYRAAPSRVSVGIFYRFRDFLDFTRFGSDLLSHDLSRSTIGAKALNFRVRDGTGCFALAIATKPRKIQDRSSWRSQEVARQAGYLQRKCPLPHVSYVTEGFISDIGRNNRTTLSQVLWCLFGSWLSITRSDQANRAISTSQLNVLPRLHLWPIDEVVYLGPQGYLVLRGASRLDAFSGYPFRT